MIAEHPLATTKNFISSWRNTDLDRLVPELISIAKETNREPDTYDFELVDGKLTVTGLIDPTGLELTPVATNPGGVAANTIWINTSDSNRLYYGSSHISGGGGGGGGSGTVTSVGMTVPTGFTITGSPITTTGTLAVGFDTG